MVRYRRVWVEGGTYFFTLTLIDRHASYLTQYIDELSAPGFRFAAPGLLGGVACKERSGLRDCGTPQVSPDCASLHPGYGVGVACKERSGLRDCGTPQVSPDCASLHPGYSVV